MARKTAVTRDERWVPPPPAPGRAAAGGRNSRRTAAPSRTTSCAGTAVAVLVALALLALCVLAALAAPVLLPGGNAGRQNLLLLGLDRRGGTSWAYRTDTILILTVDSAGGAPGLLSIPRDLQLPIPGHGEDRINTANVWGNQEDDPHAGPALLRSTIESNFGIPIHGYVMVDFQAFVRIVDALGGIEVDVPKVLHDTKYPDPRPGDPYAFKTIHFDPGPQHMDGARALEYARSRMSTSDFDRAKRQQLIVLAIRKRALSLEGIVRWPAAASAALGAVRTDLGVGELLGWAVRLAWIDPGSLRQVVLEHPFVVSYRRADGAAVQLPVWDRIRPVIAEMFGTP